MSKYLIEVNFQDHANYSVLRENSAQQAKHLNMIPIGLNEVHKTSLHYPLVWIKSSVSGQFKLVALFGFEPGENLYCKNDIWNNNHIPLHLQSDPFYLAYSNNETDKEKYLCVNINSQKIDVNGKKNKTGLTFFNGNGEKNICLHQAQEILATLAHGEMLNEMFIKTANQLDLFQSLSLDITWHNHQTSKILGLYTIDPSKLEQLNENQIYKLKSNGYIEFIHQLNYSLNHIENLIKLKNNLIVKA